MIDLTTSASLHAPSTPAFDRDELPDFLVLFSAIHDAMRRDAARLERAVLAVDAPSGARSLRSWWQRYAGVIVHHHHREDELVWPALEQRSASFAEDQAPLHEDHAVLDRVMASVDAALAALSDERVDFHDARRATADAASAFRTVLVDHLHREEQLAFPLLARTFTPEEYEALEKQMRKGSTLREAAFEVPWVLEHASPRCVAMADEVMPAVMKAFLRLSWRRRYERVAAPILEAA